MTMLKAPLAVHDGTHPPAPVREPFFCCCCCCFNSSLRREHENRIVLFLPPSQKNTSRGTRSARLRRENFFGTREMKRCVNRYGVVWRERVWGCAVWVRARWWERDFRRRTRERTCA